MSDDNVQKWAFWALAAAFSVDFLGYAFVRSMTRPRVDLA